MGYPAGVAELLGMAIRPLFTFGGQKCHEWSIESNVESRGETQEEFFLCFLVLEMEFAITVLVHENVVWEEKGWKGRG